MPPGKGASLAVFLRALRSSLLTSLESSGTSVPVVSQPLPPQPTVRALTSRAQVVLLLGALAGLLAATSAAYVHYRLLQTPGYTSFCDINTTWSCSEVYLSRFGSVRGVPVALGGAVWFVLVLLLAGPARVGPPNFRESVASYLFVLSTLALAVILYLAYVSFFVLRSVCILCLATYAAVIVVFLVSGAQSSVPMMTLPRRLLIDLRALVVNPLALALAVLFVAGAASAVAFFPGEAPWNTATALLDSPTQAAPQRDVTPPAQATPLAQSTPPAQAPQAAASQPSEFERWYTAQPRVNLPVPAEGAKVLIVKFSDYQCPACGQTYEWYKPVLAKYQGQLPGQVRFVTLDFPLNPVCNAALTRPVHLAACEAAVAARLARERGRGDAMEQWLYTNQTATVEQIKTAAREIGGVNDFDARYAGMIQLVKTDAALGGLNDVRSTPTFFINGTKVVGGLPPQFFDAAIAFELKRTRQ